MMNGEEPIKVEFVRSQQLSHDEKILLDEIVSLSGKSISNLREAFRQLINLTTTLIGLEIALLKLSNYSLPNSFTLHEFFILSFFFCMFASIILAFFGQVSTKIDVPGFNGLNFFNAYKNSIISTNNVMYIIASAFFVVGLFLFALGAVVALI